MLIYLVTMLMFVYLVTMWHVYLFSNHVECLLTRQGSGFTGGCHRSEITVLIGVVTCDIVSLSDSEIECEPPKNLRGTKDNIILVWYLFSFFSVFSYIFVHAGTCL